MTTMRHEHHADAGIDLFEETLDNGLTVCLVPREGFNQTFAMFATRYGSIDKEFVQNGEEVTVPDGIAHFLEHKMFEDEEVEVFSQFAAHGASVNAFTSFDQTAYYFSCTSDLPNNLETLLNFVQKVHLTDDNVEKEKGIIAQEIRMGDDNPDRRVFMELLREMYVEHPVRIDIAGSVDSIYQIDRQTLLNCYHTFYHPSNMVLVVSGGFDVDAVMQVIKNNQNNKTFDDAPQIQRLYPVEPRRPRHAQTKTELPVAVSRCLIGWKDESIPEDATNRMERELLTGVVLDAAFGKTSEFYGQLLKDGLIDKGFSWEYELTSGYGYAVVGGSAPNPEELADRVRRYLAKLQSNGIDEAAFHRARKKALGRFFMGMDQVSHIARSYITYELRGTHFLNSIDVLQSISYRDGLERLNEFRPEQMVFASVVPKTVAQAQVE